MPLLTFFYLFKIIYIVFVYTIYCIRIGISMYISGWLSDFIDIIAIKT